LAASLEPLAGQGHCREREQAAILEYKHTIQKCRDNGVNASLTQAALFAAAAVTVLGLDTSLWVVAVLLGVCALLWLLLAVCMAA
jgi:hypothetical protein